MKFEAYVAGGVEHDKRLLERLAAEFGGFTVTPSFGGWVSGDGKVIVERSAVISVLYPEDHPTSGWVHVDVWEAYRKFKRLVSVAAGAVGEESVGFRLAESMAVDFEDTGVRVGRA